MFCLPGLLAEACCCALVPAICLLRKKGGHRVLSVAPCPCTFLPPWVPPVWQAALAHAQVYEVASTGARVTLENASLLLHAYLSRLTADQYTVLRPLYRTGIAAGHAAVAADAAGAGTLLLELLTANLHLCL